MTPTDLRRTTYESPVGPIVLVASAAGLRAVLWPDHRSGRVPLPEDIPTVDGDPVLAATETQLAEWFAGRRTSFDLPLDPAGTDFQRRVWTALAAIPHGTTRTYAEVAEEAEGDRGKARAVGTAVGRNPLSIIVPCHRVVGADGSLTGFAGGLDVKRRLLDLEAGRAALPLDG